MINEDKLEDTKCIFQFNNDEILIHHTVYDTVTSCGNLHKAILYQRGK